MNPLLIARFIQLPSHDACISLSGGAAVDGIGDGDVDGRFVLHGCEPLPHSPCDCATRIARAVSTARNHWADLLRTHGDALSPAQVGPDDFRSGELIHARSGQYVGPAWIGEVYVGRLLRKLVLVVKPDPYKPALRLIEIVIPQSSPVCDLQTCDFVYDARRGFWRDSDAKLVDGFEKSLRHKRKVLAQLLESWHDVNPSPSGFRFRANVLEPDIDARVIKFWRAFDRYKRIAAAAGHTAETKNATRASVIALQLVHSLEEAERASARELRRRLAADMLADNARLKADVLAAEEAERCRRISEHVSRQPAVVNTLTRVLEEAERTRRQSLLELVTLRCACTIDGVESAERAQRVAASLDRPPTRSVHPVSQYVNPDCWTAPSASRRQAATAAAVASEETERARRMQEGGKAMPFSAADLVEGMATLQVTRALNERISLIAEASLLGERAAAQLAVALGAPFESCDCTLASNQQRRDQIYPIIASSEFERLHELVAKLIVPSARPSSYSPQLRGALAVTMFFADWLRTSSEVVYRELLTATREAAIEFAEEHPDNMSAEMFCGVRVHTRGKRGTRLLEALDKTRHLRNELERLVLYTLKYAPSICHADWRPARWLSLASWQHNARCTLEVVLTEKKTLLALLENVRAQFNQIKLACATAIRLDNKELAKCFVAYKKFCITVRPKFGQIKKGHTSRLSWFQRKANFVGVDMKSAEAAAQACAAGLDLVRGDEPRHALAQLFTEEAYDDNLMSVISEGAQPTAGWQRTLNLAFEGDWSIMRAVAEIDNAMSYRDKDEFLASICNLLM